MTELRWCDGCAAEVAFDRFDCDDHGADCLELVCTQCGRGVELVAVGIAASPGEAVGDSPEPHEAAA